MKQPLNLHAYSYLRRKLQFQNNEIANQATEFHLFCKYMILKSSFTLLQEEDKKQKGNFYRIAKIISFVEE